MKYLGYNYGQHLFLNNSDNSTPNLPDPLNPPAFRGEIRIPIKLHKWKPKSNYAKKHNYSLRIKTLNYDVGVAPFKIKAEMLGHFLEPKKDVDLELIVTIDAWLMSPELLDSARLEFSLTFIGEEHSTNPNRSIYINMLENHDTHTQKPQLPVWTRTHANFNVIFKLHYDLPEFERNVSATLKWHHERIKWSKRILT